MSDSPASPQRCQRCGTEFPAEVGGLCPRCLMAQIIQPTEAAAHAAPMPALTPEELAPHFPQLEIIECLGRGGMGVVYQARQKSLNRLVALKLLAPERANDPQFAGRFEKEAQALAALNHPHIVGVYDFGQAGGFYFLLMEFVDGVNLRQAMKVGRFTPEQALAVVPPVCEALQFAHEHGIVHRDIKPENLLLDKDGRVKIADFGIAKMLGGDADAAVRDEGPQAGTLASVAGTPQYMAPEQKAHRATDHRADIYSLGVVLYELLTGELPADKLQPPSCKVQIDVRLDEIVLRALEKTPELRYQTAGEFRTQVETVAATPPPRIASAPTAPADVPWQSPTMGWGHFVGSFFGIIFTSPLAFKLANLSALGFLCFLGFVPLPGWHGFFGFSGFFGLIGAAHLVEMWHRARHAGPDAARRLWWHKSLVSLVLAVAIVIPLRLFVVQSFTAATNAAAPEIPRGSRVLVWKLTREFTPGDLIAYTGGGRANLGRVINSRDDAVEVTRNGETPAFIPRAAIVGKVISIFWRGSSAASGPLAPGNAAATNTFEPTAPAPVVPEPSAVADPVPAIEMKISQQQLERALIGIEETQAELASLQSDLRPTHPKMVALKSKLEALEKQAARNRDVIQKNTPTVPPDVSVSGSATRPVEDVPQLAFTFITAAGRWVLMGGIALAFFIAHRGTALFGFRLLFAFATGQLVIGIIGFFSYAWIYNSFGLQGVTRAAYVRGALDYALYAVCLAGVISLLRNRRRLQA